MSAGEEIKDKLGLSNIERVYMARMLGVGPRRTYLVAYDSKRPSFPINSALMRGPHAPYLIRYPFEHKIRMLPLVPIERFNLDLAGVILMVVDIAGRFNDPSKLAAVESVGESTALRLDEITLRDLRYADNKMSAITRRYRKKRNTALGPENRLAKFIDVMFDRHRDTVTLVFSTPATQLPSKQTFPSHGYGLHQNPNGRYTLAIQVLKFFSWLGTTPEGATITAKDVRDVLRVADVRVSSTSPSFYWQGMCFRLSQIDAAIYPTNISDEIWGPRHFYSLLDKHLVGLINSIDFFIPFIANSLTKKLRDLGHITRPVNQRHR